LRRANGRRALAVHPGLVNKARYWARWMAAGNCGRNAVGVAMICHSVLTGGIHVQWSMLAENVGAASPSTNVIGVANGFRNSPPHLENILNASTDYVGIGVAYSGNTIYVAEEFMAA
jgi:hypothetical protein